MRTTDNNAGNFLILKDNDKYSDLDAIANRNLIDLKNDNPNLLIFPQSFEDYIDVDIKKRHIFSLNEEKLTTYNIMGFVGRKNTKLTIYSRFAKDDKNDYFLHHMLQKVFAINILNFYQTPDNENIWDFLLYLFPYYLKKAYAQGLYKSYRREDYNDANVKGTIDVKRHICTNIPFAGEIAYTTREHSHDNPVTQLIRHTIEHIRAHPWGSSILSADSDTHGIVSKICFVTQKFYNKNARQKIISANFLKPISHPYFTEYKTLQKICLRILRHEKLIFGNEKDKIYGLLFDGAWLWEEYLNTFLKKDFKHPENKKKTYKMHLFEEKEKRFQEIYPDFISKETPTIVGDAKYIPLDRQKDYAESSERATNIYYKTITYMYRFESNNGFLMFPHHEIDNTCNTYNIIGTIGKLRKLGLAIPQKINSFNDFKEKMKQKEHEMAESVKMI